jgi:AraC-like DNA-binding protein
MADEKPIISKPVNQLTWRLLGGDSRWYTPRWGDYGAVAIRDDFSRLYLLESGSAIVRTGDMELRLEPGRFYLFPAGTSAYYSCPGGMHLSWLHFNIYVLPGLDLTQAFVPPLSVAAEPGAEESFRHLLANIKSGTPAGLSRACSIAARFITPFLTADWSQVFRRGKNLANVEPVIEYIHRNLTADLTLEGLARVAGLHPVYLSRVFKKATGRPPAKYVTAVRMNYASDQLRLTDKRIGEIGAESGFDDPYHFSRVFKQFVGVAPRIYRQARSSF